MADVRGKGREESVKKPSDDLVAGWDGRTRNYYQECVVKSNWWLEVARRLRCACCLVEGTCRNRRLEGASCLCYLIERGTSKLGPGRIKHVILAFYPSNRVSIIKSAGHRMTQNPPDISCRNIFFFCFLAIIGCDGECPPTFGTLSCQSVPPHHPSFSHPTAL